MRNEKQSEMVAALNEAFSKARSIKRITVNGTFEANSALKLTRKLTKNDIEFLNKNGYLVDNQRIRNGNRVLLRLVHSYPMKIEDIYKDDF